MTDTGSFLEDVWDLFTWRILSNYVSPWELTQIKGEIEEWDQWCQVWSSWARRHFDRGDEAAAAGHGRTAAAAYVTAGLYYHWASFLFTHDAAQFRTALEAADCRRALVGMSYGGMSAIRGAVFDDRIRAAVSVSSWYSAAGRFQHQREVRPVALRQYLGPAPAAVQDTMTLEGVAERLTVPL